MQINRVARDPVFFTYTMNVYTDESGDLGWTLDKPYRHGGSSRYLTIAHALVPKSLKHIPRRLIKDLYHHMKWPPGHELKASHLKPKHRQHLASQTAKMLEENPSIKVIAITVNKENVINRFRRDTNKLYNYMIKLALLDHIKHHQFVSFITDHRSVKVASGNSLADYLQIMLYTEFDSDTVIENLPMDSKNSLNIQFADFMANFVWRSFEFRDWSAMKILSKHLSSRTLFNSIPK